MRRRLGFTLTELLIVSGILATLAALLFPILSRVREKGRQTSCLTNQRHILLATHAYIQDYDGLFPKMHYHRNEQTVAWYEALLPYTKNRHIFQCPTDTSTNIGGNWTYGPKFHSSYAASNDLLRGEGLEYLPSAPLSRVAKPATTVFLSDAGTQTDSEAPYVTTSSPNKDGCWRLWLSMNSEGSADSNACGPNLRHSGLSNVAFVDGHVKVMKVEQWFYRDSPWTTWQGG